jgi:hypothetical protein
MARVRISTTVDEERLLRVRRFLDVSDSQLLDRALAALLEELETQRELQALDEHPYEDDQDLAWQAPPGPPLPYDGEIPADVLELARQRRRSM